MSAGVRSTTLLGLVALVAIAAAALALAIASPSRALFSSSSTSRVEATADRVQEWLHLYAQPTDPDGLTGYFARSGSSPQEPAASGCDESLTVHLGGLTGTTTCDRVLTLLTEGVFPDSAVTQVTVTSSLLPDAATGKQPISGAGFAAIGSTQRRKSVTIGADVKRQLNLRVRTRGLTLNTLYQPRVRVTVTFAGFETAYYEYEIPVKIWYGSGAGPD